MFGNLRAEMARNKISGVELSDLLHITNQSFYKKMGGTSDFTLNQMIIIQLKLKDANPAGKDRYTLDYLFKP